MGLADRDYIRDVEPRRGAYGRGGWTDLRVWSVNTWLIAICVGVFALDWFVLPMRDVPTGVVVLPQKGIPESMYTIGPPELHVIPIQEQMPNGVEIVRQALCRPLVERSTGRFIGWAEVYHMHFFESFLHFSTNLGFLKFEWWRFVGFQFLHATWSHLLFNMLALFFFGPMVEQ